MLRIETFRGSTASFLSLSSPAPAAAFQGGSEEEEEEERTRSENDKSSGKKGNSTDKAIELQLQPRIAFRAVVLNQNQDHHQERYTSEVREQPTYLQKKPY